MSRGAKKRHFFDPDELRRLYVQELWASDRIAEHFGCSKPTALAAIREAGIVLRHHNDTKRGRPAQNRSPLDESAVIAAYQSRTDISQAEIARMFDVNVSVISRILVAHGVQRRSISELVKDKRNGRLNPNWKEHITAEERAQRRDVAKQAKWRSEVYDRDGYVCQCCGDATGGNLNAHHIDGHCNNKRRRWALDNGVTLCELCHRRFHRQYGYTGIDAGQLAEFMASQRTQVAA